MGVPGSRVCMCVCVSPAMLTAEGGAIPSRDCRLPAALAAASVANDSDGRLRLRLCERKENAVRSVRAGSLARARSGRAQGMEHAPLSSTMPGLEDDATRRDGHLKCPSREIASLPLISLAERKSEPWLRVEGWQGLPA